MLRLRKSSRVRREPAKFPGWDSRKYNYYRTQGRKATHYEDMTVDVQPDPERYLLQNWIISFADGTPTYSKSGRKLQSSDWHKFRAPDQEWERTHYQRQSTIEGMIKNVVDNARKSGAPTRFDQGLGQDPAGPSGRLQACRIRAGQGDHACAALRLDADDQQRDPDQLLVQAAVRPGPDAVPGRDRPGSSTAFDATPARRTGWKTRSGRAPARRSKPSWAPTDYLEQYFAINVVFEPLVGELFRSGFIMQMAAAQNDFSHRPSFRPPRPTTNRTSPIRSSCSTCWPTIPSMARPTAR